VGMALSGVERWRPLFVAGRAVFGIIATGESRVTAEPQLLGLVDVVSCGERGTPPPLNQAIAGTSMHGSRQIPIHMNETSPVSIQLALR